MSSICKAGIHAGVIQDSGGVIEMVVKEGIDKYEATINRDITSVKYDKWKRSFVISKPISAHLEMSILFNKKEKVAMFM